MSSTARTLPPSEVSASWVLGPDALPAHIEPDSLALQRVDGERFHADLRRQMADPRDMKKHHTQPLRVARRAEQPDPHSRQAVRP